MDLMWLKSGFNKKKGEVKTDRRYWLVIRPSEFVNQYHLVTETVTL